MRDVREPSDPARARGDLFAASCLALFVLLLLSLGSLEGPLHALGASTAPRDLGARGGAPTSLTAAPSERGTVTHATTSDPAPASLPSARPEIGATPQGPLPNCVSAQGLISPLTSTFNTASPPGFATPSPCYLNEDLDIAAGGNLVVSGADGIVVNASASGNGTLFLNVAGGLTVGPSSFLSVEKGLSLRLFVSGSLTIDTGGNLTLSPTSTLILGPFSRLSVAGGFFYTNGSLLAAGGGNVQVANGGVLDGSAGGPSATPGGARITRMSFEGSLSELSDSGSDVHWLNVSGSVGEVLLQGVSASVPVHVVNLSLPQSVTSFGVDDAVLSGVALNATTDVSLGSTGSASDQVVVNDLTIARPLHQLSIAHAQVSVLAVASSVNVAVENSSFGPGAASVTSAATGNFTANGSSHFGFPMVFYNPWVNLTNASAPAISVLGSANVSVYNWGTPTVVSTGGASASIAGISTVSAEVAVHVFRYVLVSVLPISPPSVPASSVQVSLCSTVPNVACVVLGVNAQGDVGHFLPTDVVTLEGLDTFVGAYEVSAVAQGTGYSAPASRVQVTSDNQQIRLTMTVPPVPPQLIPVFLIEVGGLGAVIGAIILLRTRVHRLERARRERGSGGLKPKAPRPPKGTNEDEQRERPEENTEPGTGRRRPPAREWKPPRNGKADRPAGAGGKDPASAARGPT
ncbi:MAG: hypothetical protein KGI98_01535 [Euryarchaeota archaeon]|nr:hypothetical protein [Euryarchaeota archaeon]MDE1880661.1 hypothetical protein [Euryarchaeota archaeon]